MTTGTWKQADAGTSCVRDIVGFLSFGGAEAKSFIHISWINTNQDMGKIVDVDCYELLWVVLVLITLGIVGNLVSYAGSREAALAWAFRCGAFTTFNALDPEITHVTQLNKGFPLRVPFLNSLYSIYWQIFSSRCYVANCVDFSWLGMLLSTLKAQRQIHTNNISESWDLELRARIVLCPLKKEVQCITARKLQVIRLQLLLTQPWCWIWCRFSSMCFQTHVCRYLCPQTRTLPIKKMTRALFSSCFSICWSYVVHPGFVVSRRSVFWMCPGWKLVPVAPGHQKRTSQGWIRKTWTALRHSERRSVRLSSLVLSFVGFCRHSRRQQVSYNPPCDTVRSALFGNVRKIAHGLRRVHCQKAAGRKRFWCEISLQDCSGLLVFPFPLWDTVDGKMSTSLKDGRCYLSTGAGSLSKYVAVGRWKEFWQPLPTSGFFMCKYFDRQLRRVPWRCAALVQMMSQTYRFKLLPHLPCGQLWILRLQRLWQMSSRNQTALEDEVHDSMNISLCRHCAFMLADQNLLSWTRLILHRIHVKATKFECVRQISPPLLDGIFTGLVLGIAGWPSTEEPQIVEQICNLETIEHSISFGGMECLLGWDADWR